MWRTIREDRAAYGALLTPQGKFLFDFFIAQDAGQLLLETERGAPWASCTGGS